MEILDKTGVEVLWSKIKGKFATQSDINTLQQLIDNLQTTITQLQTTINNLPTAAINDSKYIRKDKDDITPYTITAKALYKSA